MGIKNDAFFSEPQYPLLVQAGHHTDLIISHPITNPVITALRRLRKKGFLNLRLVWATHYVPGQSRLQGEALPQNTEKDFKKQKSNQ